jgi:hypothetical protein
MLPYKLRAPVYGSVEENKLRKTDGTDKDVMTGGGPVPKAIASDLKAFQTGVVTHFHELQHDDGTKWGYGKAFGVFKHLFGAGKIGLLHWLIPHIKCDQEAYAQIIYAACFECFRDASDLIERCASVMMLYTLYETSPLVRTEDLKPEDYIPVGLQWREYPRALFRRAFRQRIRIDRMNFLQLLSLREECRLFIDKAHVDEFRAPLVGVVGDTIVILDRLSSHWDFCEYTGPVGLEAMAGHPDYPYRDYQEEESMPSHSSDQGVSSTSGAEERVCSQSELKAVVKEYESTIQAIHLGSAKTKLVSDLRKTLHPVLPQEGKPSWISRISGAESHDRCLGNPTNRGAEKSAIDREEEVDTFKSRPLVIAERQPEHKATHRLLVCEEISDESQKLLEDALEVLVQRNGMDFIKKGSGFQGLEGASDISTLGGVGAATIATGQGRAALETLLAAAHAPDSIPTRVGATSKRDWRREPPHTSWNRFLHLGFDTDSDNQEDDSSNISNVSFDSVVHDDDDEASVATSAIGQRALDLLLSKVSKPITKSSSGRQKNPARRKPLTPSQDDQSKASSMETGQAALCDLLEKVDSRHNRTGMCQPAQHEAKPPAMNRTRLTAHGIQLPQPRLSTRIRIDEQSMASSVGVGDLALGELMKRVHHNDATLQDETNPPAKKQTRSKAQGMQPPRPRIDARRRVEQDELSLASSVGVGNQALDELMKRVRHNDATLQDETNPPAKKRTRSKAQGMQPPRPRINARRRVEQDELSTASSVGVGNQALDELLKLASKKSVDRK